VTVKETGFIQVHSETEDVVADLGGQAQERGLLLITLSTAGIVRVRVHAGLGGLLRTSPGRQLQEPDSADL
jgi:hypothetical protein